MAKQKSDVNKSEEIRQLLKKDPKMPAQEVIATLANQGIKVKPALVYFVKGRMRGMRGRRRKMRRQVAAVAVTTGNTDAVATILKVKGWANDVGGMKKLKALVDALSQ